MFGIFKKKKETVPPFKPNFPLTWWIDDLTHESCGLVDDPQRGLEKMPWPDCEKVYLAVDKEAYDLLHNALKEIVDAVNCKEILDIRGVCKDVALSNARSTALKCSRVASLALERAQLNPSTVGEKAFKFEEWKRKDL